MLICAQDNLKQVAIQLLTHIFVVEIFYILDS
jgi:hypothetical protein